MNIPNLPNLPLDANGWSILKESADTKKYYVSSSTGNDANDGSDQSKPLKTLKAGVAKLRNNSADWLLLKANDVWDESMQVWGKNGKSPTERIVITTYGGNSRAIISQTKSTGEGIRVAKCQNLAVVGIHVKAADKSPKSSNFNPKAPRNHGISVGEKDTHNILLEDNYVELYETNILLVYVTHEEKDFNTNIVVRRNILADSWHPDGKAMNLYASAMKNFTIEENVFDRGGHVPDIKQSVQTGFSHNIYLSTNNGPSYIVGNILARPASHGAQQRSGGLMKNNLAIDCPWHYLVGLNESEVCYNVGLGSANLPTTKLGFGIEVKSATSTDVHHNIIANKPAGVGGWPAYKFTFNSTNGFIGGTTIPLTHNAKIDIHDNVAYKWNSNDGVLRIDVINDSIVSVTGNTIVEQGFPTSSIVRTQLAGCKYTIKDNKYSTDQPLAKFAWVDGKNVSFADWKTATGDNSLVTTVSLPDPTRNIESYCKTIGLKMTVADFIAAAKLQSRFNWKPELTAAVVNEYIRAGFGVTPLAVVNNKPPVVLKPIIEKVWIRSITNKQDLVELKNGDTIILSQLPAAINFKVQVKDGTAVRMALDNNSVLEINDPFCYPGDDKLLGLSQKDYTFTATAYGNDDGVTNPSDPITINFKVLSKPIAKLDSVVITDTNGDASTFKASTSNKGIAKVTVTFGDGTEAVVAK